MRVFSGKRKVAQRAKPFVHMACPVARLGGSTKPSRLPARRSTGFSLLEVLISILLLGVGVLGMLGLQAWSLRTNVQAHYQATAVRLARDLGELMRSNPTVAMVNNASTNKYLINAAPAAAATNCFTSACANASDVAAWDIHEWYDRANAELPGIKVVVCYDSAPYNAGGIPIWTCTPGTTPANNSPVVKIGWTRASTKNGENAVLASVRPGVVVPVSLRTN